MRYLLTFFLFQPLREGQVGPMKFKKFFLVACFFCFGCTQSSSLINNSKSDNNRSLNTRSYGTNAWWNNWPRVTYNTTYSGAKNTFSNMVNAADGAADEGRGPLFREITFSDAKSGLDQMQADGIKKLACHYLKCH